MEVTDNKVPWPETVGKMLIEHRILTVEQVFRLLELKNGKEILSVTTDTDENDWSIWKMKIEKFLSEKSKALSEFDPKILLTEDMIGSDPILKDKHGETDDKNHQK